MSNHLSNEHQHNEHPHDHDHDHEHPHDHDHEHSHDHGDSLWATLRQLIPFGHSHTHAEINMDAALEGNSRGIWAVKVSLLGLGATALIQFMVVIISGSVGLLADTIHNFSDALTAVPLWLAFSLAQRPANRRYTYGYGRAEDVAGLFIVLMILLSSLVAGYESVQKLINPSPITNLWWVGAAALVGFLGNEAVAAFRIRIGNEIGSAALRADGLHARADGFTSLAVLLGVLGVALGFPIADPLVGILITIAILFVLKDAAVLMWHRLMDAVEPGLVDKVEHEASEVAGVVLVDDVRVRWLGHRLRTELNITVDEDLPTSQSHHIAEMVRYQLLHTLPKLEDINIHVNPCGHSGVNHHQLAH